MKACNILKLGLTCNKNKLLDLITMQNKHESMQQFKTRTYMQLQQTVGLNFNAVWLLNEIK